MQTDSENVAGLGDYTCEGSLPELEVHLSGCGSGRWAGPAGRRPRVRPGTAHSAGAVRRVEGGDPRFWTLVTVLPDAAQEAGDAALAEGAGHSPRC